jgi:hypothetical protein
MRAARRSSLAYSKVIPVSVSPADPGWTDAAAPALGLPRPFATVWRFVPNQPPIQTAG